MTAPFNKSRHPNQATVATVPPCTTAPCRRTFAPHRHISPARCACSVILRWVFPNVNAPGVRPQHRAVPDAAVFLKPHAARQCGVFGHKRRAVVGRGMVVYCDESHTIASPFFSRISARCRGRRPRRPGPFTATVRFRGLDLPLTNLLSAEIEIANTLPNVLQYSRNHKGVVLWQSK